MYQADSQSVIVLASQSVYERNIKTIKFTEVYDEQRYRVKTITVVYIPGKESSNALQYSSTNENKSDTKD